MKHGARTVPSRAVPAWVLLAVPVAAQHATSPAECLPAAAAGLTFLAHGQTADGGWPVPASRQHDRFADTALAALAFLAEGSSPDTGEFGTTLRRAVDFLADRIPPDGPLRVDAPRPGDWQRFESWYAALGALVFLELQLREPARHAVPLERLLGRLGALQKPTGGWCHDLAPRVRQVPGLGRAEYSDDLLAVGGLALFVLAGARDAGVAGPPPVLARGAAWLAGLQNQDGGFQYGLGHTWPDARLSEPGRTAAALLTLVRLHGRFSAGARGAARYLDARMTELPFSAGHGGNPFVVSWLSGALACSQWGTEALDRYLTALLPDLLRRQRGDGRFVLGNSAWDTPANSTAVAVVCLLVNQGRLRMLAAAPATADAAARGAAWLRARRQPDGASWSGTFGDGKVDLALTALAARALWLEDPLGAHAERAAASRWLAEEVLAMAGANWNPRGRSHLGFQLPLLLPLLLDGGERAAALAVIERLQATQRPDGGWTYDGTELYTLLATTAACVSALQDARDRGAQVPSAALDQGLAYLRACAGKNGGFRYCPDPAHPILAKDRARYLREEVCRTLMAVAALGAAGDKDAVAGAVAFLDRHLDELTIPAGESHLWFNLHWGVSARRFLPPRLAARLHRLLEARLRDMQAADGSFAWPGIAWSAALSREPMHQVFATAVATALLVDAP